MIDLMGIKNIIFDLGGVLLNIDYNRAIHSFKKLGASNFAALFSQTKQEGLFDDFEKGLISVHFFRTRLREHLEVEITDTEIDHAWNSMLLDFPQIRVKMLESLSLNYKLLLLSNTNEIHHKAVRKIISAELNIPDLHPLFDKVYYSHRLGMRKPDKKIFELVLKDSDSLADETLFIDDTIRHLQGGAAIGLHTYLHNTNEEIEALFNL